MKSFSRKGAEAQRRRRGEYVHGLHGLTRIFQTIVILIRGNPRNPWTLYKLPPRWLADEQSDAYTIVQNSLCYVSFKSIRFPSIQSPENSRFLKRNGTIKQIHPMNNQEETNDHDYKC